MDSLILDDPKPDAKPPIPLNSDEIRSVLQKVHILASFAAKVTKTTADDKAVALLGVILEKWDDLADVYAKAQAIYAALRPLIG